MPRRSVNRRGFLFVTVELALLVRYRRTCFPLARCQVDQASAPAGRFGSVALNPTAATPIRSASSPFFAVHFVDPPFFGFASRTWLRVVLAALFRLRGTSFDAGHTEFNSRASSRPGRLTRQPPLAIACAFRFSEEQRSWPSALGGFTSGKRAHLLRRWARLQCSSNRPSIGRFSARLGPLVAPAELARSAAARAASVEAAGAACDRRFCTNRSRAGARLSA